MDAISFLVFFVFSFRTYPCETTSVIEGLKVPARPTVRRQTPPLRLSLTDTPLETKTTITILDIRETVRP